MPTFQRNLLPESLGQIVITYLLTPWSRVLLEKLTGSATSQQIVVIIIIIITMVM
jgi:hypothetical protein